MLAVPLLVLLFDAAAAEPFPPAPGPRAKQAMELSAEPELTLQAAAYSLHRSAQRSKRVRDYRLAQALYEEWLRRFPSLSEAQRIRFYLAELLWDLDQWEQAEIEYTRVRDEAPEGWFRRQAARNVLFTRMKAFDGFASRELSDADKVNDWAPQAREEPPPDVRRLHGERAIEHARKFMGLYCTAPESVRTDDECADVSRLLGLFLHALEIHDEDVELLEESLQRSPGDRRVRDALAEHGKE